MDTSKRNFGNMSANMLLKRTSRCVASLLAVLGRTTPSGVAARLGGPPSSLENT